MAGFAHGTGEHTREQDTLHSLKRFHLVESVTLESAIEEPKTRMASWVPGIAPLE
jgi:hypothetical protein